MVEDERWMSKGTQMAFHISPAFPPPAFHQGRFLQVGGYDLVWFGLGVKVGWDGSGNGIRSPGTPMPMP